MVCSSIRGCTGSTALDSERQRAGGDSGERPRFGETPQSIAEVAQEFGGPGKHAHGRPPSLLRIRTGSQMVSPVLAVATAHAYDRSRNPALYRPPSRYDILAL